MGGAGVLYNNVSIHDWGDGFVWIIQGFGLKGFSQLYLLYPITRFYRIKMS